MLVFKDVDDLLLLLLALVVLQVVKVQLVLKIVDVSIFFNVDSVESFKISLETFVFFLVLWLNIFDPLEALVSSLKLLLSSLDLVEQFRLVLSELLHSLLHLVHFLGLSVDDIADAFLNVLLL